MTDKLLLEVREEIAKRQIFVSEYILDPHIRALVARLTLVEPEARLAPDSTLEFELNFSFAGDKERLERVWHELRTEGWNLIEGWERPKSNEAHWCGRFTKEGSKFSLWFTFSSTVCRRVKVGTQMVEQDVYETVCGDEQADKVPVPAAQDDDIPF